MRIFRSIRNKYKAYRRGQARSVFLGVFWAMIAYQAFNIGLNALLLFA